MLIKKLAWMKYLVDWMNEAKAVRKKQSSVMYLMHEVERLVSPNIALSVMSFEEELPAHVPIRELKVMLREARYVEADMLLEMTCRESPVLPGLPCK